MNKIKRKLNFCCKSSIFTFNFLFPHFFPQLLLIYINKSHDVSKKSLHINAKRDFLTESFHKLGKFSRKIVVFLVFHDYFTLFLQYRFITLVSRSSKGFTAFELLTAPQQFSNDNEKSLPQNKSSLDKKKIPPSVTQQVMVYCV